MANKSTVYLLADEIDHITIRYTDFGEPLNKKAGIKKILYCCARYKKVARRLSAYDVRADALYALPESELYTLMVTVRDTLLYDVLRDC